VSSLQLGAGTCVLVCAGPSLDGLSAAAWAEIQQAEAVVAVNGALVAEACLCHGVRFTYAAAMDVALGLGAKVPGFAAAWASTPAWRVTAVTEQRAAGESHVREVEWWSDDPDEGLAGGSTAMVIGNWLCHPWPDGLGFRASLEETSRRTGKPVPPRGFQRLAFVGLDMLSGQGAHARGAGTHASGFSHNPKRYVIVMDGWDLFCAAAGRRGVEVVNLTPGTALQVMPRMEVPAAWLEPAPAAADSLPPADGAA
jgi:hypothetical protein